MRNINGVDRTDDTDTIGLVAFVLAVAFTFVGALPD